MEEIRWRESKVHISVVQSVIEDNTEADEYRGDMRDVETKVIKQINSSERNTTEKK